MAECILIRGPLKARHALEQAAPIGPAGERIDEIFRMRHQAQHIYVFGINPDDIIVRPVRIGAALPVAARVAKRGYCAPKPTASKPSYERLPMQIKQNAG